MDRREWAAAVVLVAALLGAYAAFLALVWRFVRMGR